MDKKVKVLVELPEEDYNYICDQIAKIREEQKKYGYAKNDVVPLGFCAIADGTLVADDAISRSALRKQFEDRSLEDFTHLHFIDAIDNAPEFGKENNESALTLPQNPTNGDRIKAMFPTAEIFRREEYGYQYVFVTIQDMGNSWKIRGEWWDAPYKEK